MGEHYIDGDVVNGETPVSFDLSANAKDAAWGRMFQRRLRSNFRNSENWMDDCWKVEIETLLQNILKMS